MSKMREFKQIHINDELPGVIVFEEDNNKFYSFDLKHLAEHDSRFKEVAYRYNEPFVLKRSVFHTMIPDCIVSFVNWQNDNCDIPVSGFYFDYEYFFVPFLEPIKQD